MSDTIVFDTAPLKNFRDDLNHWLVDVFQFRYCCPADGLIKKYLTHFIEDLYVAIEHPFADYLYRDSYYTYYSSKHRNYQRDCIRISLYSQEITKEMFVDIKKTEYLKENFLGFFLIRPIRNHPIGRSVVSPKALREHDILVCLVDYTIHVRGLPLSCTGFPHASQTSETITCAETSIWNVSEYFSLRYHEYSPTSPSGIIDILNPQSYSRLVPSRGLTMAQICYSLKAMGFAALLYTAKADEADLRNILYCYVESGIPVILGLSSEEHLIGHAVTCIGHQKCDYNTVEFHDSGLIKDVKVYDTAALITHYVIIDDNYPPYQIANYDQPCAYYNDEPWNSAKISSVVVPLAKEIYLDARKARKLLTAILNDQNYGLKSNIDQIEEDYVLRFFLTSNSSFKMKVRKNTTMSDDMKKELLDLRLPKFIWVAEISKKSEFLKGFAESLILLDSTGDDSFDSLLFLSYSKFRLVKSSVIRDNREYIHQEIIQHEWQKFNIFRNNLKGEWCQWKVLT